jgi:hypothetical protein
MHFVAHHWPEAMIIAALCIAVVMRLERVTRPRYPLDVGADDPAWPFEAPRLHDCGNPEGCTCFARGMTRAIERSGCIYKVKS